MSKKSTKKSLTEMNTEELAAATREFDAEFVADSFSSPSKEEQARWARARKKPGRPPQGLGAKVISVSVERDLLARSDALAAKMGLTRAALVARGLRAVLAVEGES